MSRFLIYMNAQDAQDFLQETAGFQFRESRNPHGIIARAGFWCRKLLSC